MSIKNAPSSAYQWYGSLGTPETSSGWLAIDETWTYRNDPGGAYAFVSVIDYDLQQIVFAQNLGPIMKGKNYIFDCATGQLLSQRAV
ncbi:unnamed protein product [marine sediment metagenome]|uniref:Uncharacterized protein n=1 Tax=marine sediment metagenome TaxID=412755 RepID=X1R996_9ZZZZ